MPMPSRARVALMIVTIGVALSACGTVHSTYVPDGRRGYAITCGGFFNSWSACLVKAGRSCGSSGYEIIKGNEEDRGMLIACKLPGSPAASPAH